MKVIILAAGLGSRLGHPFPKPLTPLYTDETILGRQIKLLTRFVNENDINIVVGFQKEKIMETFPDVCYAENSNYSETNTAKSLLTALKKIENDDILWLNGDIVFEDNFLDHIFDRIESGKPFSTVNRGETGDEEVKYLTDDSGRIIEISKQVKNGEGESLGINFITSGHLDKFKKYLEKAGDRDYFEKAMDNAARDGSFFFDALDLSSCMCKEVDFPEDLDAVNKFFAKVDIVRS